MPKCLALIAAVLLGGCDGYTTLSGYVVDGDGAPITGAAVSMQQGGSQVGIETLSNEHGAFGASGCHAPSREPILLRVHKDGFYDDTRRLPPNTEDHNMRIVLERERVRKPTSP